jgi:hypothetical protein
MSVLPATCGVVLAAIGSWSSYRNARDAVAPAVHEGDPTRSAIEAGRPPYARPAVRRAARSVVISIGWLVLAMYGLFLVSTGSVVGGLA